jgi:hypothetical protein
MQLHDLSPAGTYICTTTVLAGDSLEYLESVFSLL